MPVTTFGGINRLIPDIELTSDYTVNSQYGFFYVDAISSDVTVTLPAAPSRGNEYTIKKVNESGGNVVIAANGKTIDGDSTVTITGSGQSAITVRYIKGKWFIV